MIGRLKGVVLRRRFDVLALAVAGFCAIVHGWSDSTPVAGGIVHQAQRRGSPTAVPVLRAIQVLEGRATDLQFFVRGAEIPHPDVLLAVVDERGAQRFGRWPWPRSLIAQALRRLHDAHAAAVGLDMIFTDETGDRGQDLELAALFEETPEVVQGALAYPPAEAKEFQAKLSEEVEALEPHLLRSFPGAVRGTTFPINVEDVLSLGQYSAQTPLPVLARSAKHLAHLNTVPDPDGVLRRVPLFAKLEKPSGLLPALELQTAAVYFQSNVEPAYDPQAGRLAGAWLTPVGRGRILVPLGYTEPYSLINYVGPSSVFNKVSLSDVIDGSIPAADLKGKAVLVGVTLVGNYDQRVTPFSEIEPGLYTHASFLSNILSNRFLTRPPNLRFLEMAFMFAAAFALARFLPRARYGLKLLSTLVIAASWMAVDQLLFARGLKLAAVMPLASVFLSSFGLIFLGYLSVDREKAQLRGAFQYYLNPSVMEQMLANPDRLKLGGEERLMTVLFSDIRNFTSISEHLSPEGLVTLINNYLSPMTQIVFDQGGTLDKYIGDALMAFWGAPLDQPEHASRACQAALRFLAALKDLNARRAALPPLEIGIGINSGPMIVGNMGSDLRFNYTVMGDSVNLASRLEGANKEYGTRILISESTHRLVKDAVSARYLGTVRVKGKGKAVGVYELRGGADRRQGEQEAVGIFEAAVEAFAHRQLDHAERDFKQVLTLWPEDGPSRLFLNRIAAARGTLPGEEWDASYTLAVK